ncbi:hypothetical protein LINPERPRIM_LOCUS40405 [Linum perenne]
MPNCSSTSRVGVIAVFLMSVLIFQCQLGKADEDVGGNGSWRSSSSSSYSKISSSNRSDPAQIVAKAMQCFNNKTIYRNCDEELRLNESGSLVITRPMSAEEMEAYCKGACFMETNLVFNCVQGIMNNFRFYNNATVNDVKNSLKEACTSITATDSPSATGNVEVAPKHLQASQTSDISAASCSLYAIIYVMAIQAFLTW